MQVILAAQLGYGYSIRRRGTVTYSPTRLLQGHFAFNICSYVDKRVCVCVCVSMYVYDVHVHVHVHVCVCVYVCVCMCICVHAYATCLITEWDRAYGQNIVDS